MFLSIFIILSISALVCKGESEPLNPKCDDCHLKHYQIKGCTPVFSEGTDCPVRFDCPPLKKQEDKEVCLYRGKSYKKYEEINTGNPCLNCHCIPEHKSVYIKCNSKRCPNEMLKILTNSSCYFEYKEDQCCPEPECSKDSPVHKIECEYDGKKYRYGDIVYKDDLKTCICNDKWNGINGSSCRTSTCLMLELYEKQWKDGCIPIYKENTCCPIDRICDVNENYREIPRPYDDMGMGLRMRNRLGQRNSRPEIPYIYLFGSATKEEIDSGNACYFSGQHFKKGHILRQNDNCVTCTCDIPPDFTCVRKKCPGPPNGDYNYKSYLKHGECCPSYLGKELDSIE